MCARQVDLSIDGGCRMEAGAHDETAVHRAGRMAGAPRCRSLWLRASALSSQTDLLLSKVCCSKRQLRAPMAEGAAAAVVVVGDAQVRASCTSAHRQAA